MAILGALAAASAAAQPMQPASRPPVRVLVVWLRAVDVPLGMAAADSVRAALGRTLSPRRYWLVPHEMIEANLEGWDPGTQYSRREVVALAEQLRADLAVDIDIVRVGDSVQVSATVLRVPPIVAGVPIARDARVIDSAVVTAPAVGPAARTVARAVARQLRAVPH